MPFTSTTREVPATRRRRVLRRTILLVLAGSWAGVAWWQTSKTLPPGVHVDSDWFAVAPAQVSFIADITSADAYGRPSVSQAIFDEVLQTVRAARHFVVLDYYLFNSYGLTDTSGRQMAGELRDELIEKRRLQPDLQVLLITDPIDEVYGELPSQDLLLLRAAGVQVVVTDLDRLRDPNFMYSSLWRLTTRWWSGDGRAKGRPRNAPGQPADGWPSPYEEAPAPLSFTAWARMLNFKANQRRVVIADDADGALMAVVGSADIHDASSMHSNTALKLLGPAVQPLLQSELSVAAFSGWQGRIGWQPNENRERAADKDTTTRAKIMTEGATRAQLLERLDGCVGGDNIDIAVFYIADRGIIESLLAASRRGVNVRLILDPNKDAYGQPRWGIPNQPVASELVAASDGAIHVRWYRTHGEQFHAKLVVVYGPRRLWLTVGSADLTRRNLLDYDLEANIALETDRNSHLAQQTLAYFETLWSNRASLGIEYSADFGYYADPSQLHYWLYRMMEGTGASIF